MAQSLSKPNSQLETAQQHFDLLHHAGHGTAIVWEKPSAGATGRWLKLRPGDEHIPTILAAQDNQGDRYLSVNEFHGWRLVRDIKSLRACYVDIDGSTDLTAAQEALMSARLPQPSMVVFSGRGLHLYWLHEPAPGRVLPIWQRCQDALVKALLPLGADPAAKDCTRVLRLVGSINSKNGAEVRGLVLDPVPYGFHHLCDEVLGYRTPHEPKIRDFATAKAARGQRICTGSIYDRWHLVYRDLLTIADHHKSRGGIPEGCRNNWLFLSSVALSWFAHPATLKNELERQASVWGVGLSAGEIENAMKTALDRAASAANGELTVWDGAECDPRYKFKRETLYEWLQPIIPDELEHKLRAIVGDKVRRRNKQETNKKHEATRDRVADGRHASNKRGRKVDAASLEQTKPWNTMGISRRTYYNRKKTNELSASIS